jgi:hypothetical protein
MPELRPAETPGAFSIWGLAVFNLRLDGRDFQRRTSQIISRHLPQAEVWALNWTAQDVVEAMQGRMRVVFDRPTRFTLNAFRIQFATKARRTATVTEKDLQGRRHFLKVQEEGGARPQTGLERMMTGQGGGGAVAAAVPTSAARLDASGNWSAGERNQAVAQVLAQQRGGPAPSGRGASRRGGASYFVPRNGGLSPGIWKRTGPGQIAKIISFISRPARYGEKLGFAEEALRVYRAKLPENFQRALRRALSTAR